MRAMQNDTEGTMTELVMTKAEREAKLVRGKRVGEENAVAALAPARWSV